MQLLHDVIAHTDMFRTGVASGILRSRLLAWLSPNGCLLALLMYTEETAWHRKLHGDPMKHKVTILQEFVER